VTEVLEGPELSDVETQVSPVPDTAARHVTEEDLMIPDVLLARIARRATEAGVLRSVRPEHEDLKVWSFSVVRCAGWREPLLNLHSLDC
jgi:hypothetical protein